MEVEGEMLEEEERLMTVWCLVRRKGGQEEKVVSAVLRGWEEYKSKFPHLAHYQRQEWSEKKAVRAWLAGGDESRLEESEYGRRSIRTEAQMRKVEEWLRGGGELEEEEFYSD